MSEHVAAESAVGSSRVAEQGRFLPWPWRAVDRGVIRATECSVCLVGVLFTVMVTLEVVSRYVFNFSISFINAAAKLLLVWFFLLGAGLALRHGAHVGFEFALRALSAGGRRIVSAIGQLLVLVFCLQMLWSALAAIGPSLHQHEPGLGISMLWVVLALLVGFSLVTYHLITLAMVEFRRFPAARDRP